MVKRAGMIAWLAGIAALIGLTIWSGPEAVGHAVANVGWGIALVVIARAVTIIVAGAGWWLLFPARLRPKLGTCILLRFIREGANVLLPLTQVGGDVIGARLMVFFAVSGPLSAASVIVDTLVQASTQLLFACLGLLVLLILGANHGLAGIIAVGLAMAALLLVGFFLAQRRGGQRILEWAVGWLRDPRKWDVLGTIDTVYLNLTTIYAARSNILGSSMVHMAGWFIGISEVLIVFAFLGHPVGVAEALVIESLLHAIRGAAFAIPSALGAQEGGLILLCAIFAIPPEQAIALSLVRRAADVVLGVPSLVIWQALEVKQFKSAARPGSPHRSPARSL